MVKKTSQKSSAKSNGGGNEYKEFLQAVRLTDKQKEFFKTIENNTITLATGPAGTSKTFTACFAAINALAGMQPISSVILTKPIVEAGENLGFLPGSVDEKISPYMESFVTTFEKIIGKKTFDNLREKGIIQMRPIAYMRGSTFNNCFMILDEAQNMSFHQLMTYITRLGDSSRMVICGDVSQYDIRHSTVALPDFVEMIQEVNSVGSFKFDKNDVVRNKIIIDIVDRYEDWKEKNPHSVHVAPQKKSK